MEVADWPRTVVIEDEGKGVSDPGDPMQLVPWQVGLEIRAVWTELTLLFEPETAPLAPLAPGEPEADEPDPEPDKLVPIDSEPEAS